MAYRPHLGPGHREKTYNKWMRLIGATCDVLRLVLMARGAVLEVVKKPVGSRANESPERRPVPMWVTRADWAGDGRGRRGHRRSH